MYIKSQKSFICMKLLIIFVLFVHCSLNVYYNVLVQAIYFFIKNTY